jgi:ABC-type antimicrobial peptide transport system permease subunit
LAILVAAASFTLLTAASITSRVQTTGTIRTNLRSAYDILVRPHGSTTPLERTRGLVQENYLSGIFGGISIAQYRQIERLPGIDIAAPIANLGYFAVDQVVHLDLRPYLTDAPVQLFRVQPTYIANAGLVKHLDGLQYLYLTRVNPFEQVLGEPVEHVNGHRYRVCSNYFTAADASNVTSAFDLAARSRLACFSTRSYSYVPLGDRPSAPKGFIGVDVLMEFPVLLAAVDPEAENRLVGLEHALVSGRSLRAGEGPGSLPPEDPRSAPVPEVPILATSRSFVRESLELAIQRLSLPRAVEVPAELGSARARPFLDGLHGTHVATANVAPARIFAGQLPALSGLALAANYWSTAPVSYDVLGSGRLVPRAVRNPPSTWLSSLNGDNGLDLDVPIDNADTQFRRITLREGTNGAGGLSLPGGRNRTPALRLVGRYDPTLLTGFSPLSDVPLESYRPPAVHGADARSRALLHTEPLGPDRNIGGYVAQPPTLLTTLSSVHAFTNSRVSLDVTNTAPISVIRVRIAGVNGLDPLGRERINQVASLIRERTGLDVDITIGSSPAPQIIMLPATRHGQPPLLVREGWAKKGVAVSILKAVDHKSVLLFGLILLVCGLFIANATTAAISARRTELGILACLGWSTRQIAASLLGEVALTGLVAGSVGASLALPGTKALNIHVSPSRVLLVPLVAVSVAVASAAVPVLRAARLSPSAAVRPAVVPAHVSRSANSVVALAVVNLFRRPLRTCVAALALALGIAALTVLLAITLGFRGAVVGTLLGDTVALRVRGIDYSAAWIALVLGAGSVADVLYLNVSERAFEFATLRAVGWGERPLLTVVAVEGLAIGTLGGVVGAGAGACLAVILAGGSGAVVKVATVGAFVGIVLAGFAAVGPTLALRRLPIPRLLAADA